MPTKKLVRTNPEIVQPFAELPTVPEAFRRTEYEGWPTEVVKRFQLKRYQKTQAERIAVLKQINEIQAQCQALRRNESDWRHFAHEDRIRQKRLDLQEMDLDQKMEDLRYERERKLYERANPLKAPTPPKPRDVVEEITSHLEQAIRTQASVKEVFKKARDQNPHLAEWLDDWEIKIGWDLREGKWS